MKKPINPEAQKLLESVLQQSGQPNSVPQTIITHLKPAPAEVVEGSAGAATTEEEKKE